MIVENFINNFVESNTLIRLWTKEGSNYRQVEKDNTPFMEHELVNSVYKDSFVVGVKDILCYEDNYIEAVNLVIE